MTSDIYSITGGTRREPLPVNGTVHPVVSDPSTNLIGDLPFLILVAEKLSFRPIDYKFV